MNRQAVLLKAGDLMEIQESSVPEPPTGGLVLKTQYAGICHSDLLTWKNSMSTADGKSITMNEALGYTFPLVLVPNLPNVVLTFHGQDVMITDMTDYLVTLIACCPGHEIAGEVHSLGPNQPPDGPKLSVSDKVILLAYGGCRKCAYCKGGDRRQCEQTLKYLIGAGTAGGFSSYVKIPDSTLVFKVSDSFALDVGAILSCGGLTAYNAVDHAKPYIEYAAKVLKSATMLIVGAGGVGLWAIQIAKSLLPGTRIVAADIKEERLHSATSMGADATVLWDIEASDDEIVTRTREVCGGGFDAALDMVGGVSTTSRIFKAANKGAAIICVGLEGGTFKLPLAELSMKSLSLHGVFMGSEDQFKQLLAMMEQDKVKAPPISHVDLDQVNDIFKKLQAGSVTGRAVIKF